MRKLSAKQAVAEIRKLEVEHKDDPELMHAKLDGILLELVPKTVWIAYSNADWWASA